MKPHVKPVETSSSEQLGTAPASPQTTTDRAAITSSAPPAAPEARFAQDNHPKIITGVTGKLLPNGGTMQIRLDPPEMGALSVTIRIDRGVVEASFQTSNDQATQLLGHSLNQLKNALESAGVSVDKLNVSQVNDPKQASANNPQDQQDSQQSQEQARQFQQEQQRREMLKRMWQKLSGTDDLDMVA
jgi:flagellar hook-length control protein FliK